LQSLTKTSILRRAHRAPGAHFKLKRGQAVIQRGRARLRFTTQAPDKVGESSLQHMNVTGFHDSTLTLANCRWR
jgi:hypothetical protein